MAITPYKSPLRLNGNQDTFIQMRAQIENPHGSTADLQRAPSTDETTDKASWRSLFFFTTRKHSLVIVIAVFSSLLSALLKPALAIFFGKIFSNFTKFGLGVMSGPEALIAISRWCIALVSLGGAAWLIEGVFLSSWMVFGELQAKSVREQMFVGLLDKEMEWYDLRQDGSGSLLIRLQTQIQEFQMGVSQPMGFLVYEVFGSLAALGLAFFYSWKLTLVILAAFPVAGIMFFLVSLKLSPAIEAQKRDLTIASKYANTAITAINTVKAYNGQDQEVWQYYDTIKKVAASYLIQARCNALQFGITKFLTIGIFIQGFWFGLVLVKEGLDPGSILTTFYACLAAMQGLETVLPQWLVLKKGMSAGQALKAIMIHVKHGRVVKNSVGLLLPDNCEGDIEVKGVSFAYPSNSQQYVLNDADFFFPAGETTFIVGTSGSGKSTLSNLLMKYYEPTHGEILIDGNPIRTLDSAWLRQNITLVQQQSVLFNETVLQNIEFGKNEPVSRQDILQATRTADLEQTLLDLPDGLHTPVGSNGKSLSGGQQQRIVLARARLRDAPIVIFDESTSALDQSSREKVAKTIREWRRGKTTIVITHDISQILDDEYVYVLEHGLVVQEGYRKTLADKKHGTFASFLSEVQTPELDTTMAKTRWNSKPDAPTCPTSPVGDFDETVPRQEGYISKLLGIQQPSPNVFSLAPGTPAVILGGGAAHANVLLADNIWATPLRANKGSFETFYSSEPRRSDFELMKPSILQQETVKQQPPLSINGSQSLHPSLTSAVGTKKHHVRPPVIDAAVPVGLVESSPVEMTILQVQESKTSWSSLAKRKPATLRRIFGTIWPTLKCRERCVFIFGFATALIVAGGTPAFAYVLSKLLQVYYLRENREEEALRWALALLAIATVEALATFCSHYSLEYSGQAWVNALRVEALKRIMAQPRSWFDKERNSPSKFNECLDRNAEEMRNLIGRFAGPIFTTFWMLAASIIWAFIISWKLTLVAMACGPVLYAATRAFNWVSSKWENKSNRASDYTSSIFTETFANIRVVRALTLENHFRRKHSKATSETYKTGVFRALYSGTLYGLADTLSYMVTAVVFYYGTIVVTKRELPVSSVMEVVNLLLFGIANAASMMNLVPQINTSRTTATHMLYLANLPLRGSHETAGSRRVANPFPIVLNNLSFTYPGRRKTLSGISLTLAAGSCTALVGPSGSGKSTIASLLLGLYSPDTPRRPDHPPPLTFNNIPVNECNISNVRSFISCVPQQPHLFPSSILSNIIYGLAEGSPFANVEAVSRAAEEAGIHDFIMSLPNGYLTLIGEGGMGLSGGQAQRIAIARALVRHPKVLILDEATSALDAVSAEAVRDTVRRILERGRKSGGGGMAVLIISHGVEMMRIASEVVVIEDGKVVECGGFEELKSRGGAFSRLIGTKVKPGDVEQKEPMTPVKGLGRNRESWAWMRKNNA
ncbi:hypothetical protein ONS95_010331 [Cadophora gregata]|uniref:uncharacterized protein n=1 Tax=Cadophora gregata TaxID=51156 RepID=UPI0026DCE1D8|nr:uncharacterized protein ONS95_010331 [Cadophora gregata]KAK0122067.1 hypothetical protein ONS95_010331 [Cadophora gregata]KAK0127542.1 hypothetical protein ONS96_007077 [Cadophora gregata f. sp. sojae]